MVLLASDTVLPTPNIDSLLAGVYNDELDVCMSVECFHEFKLVAAAEESSNSSFRNESPRKEKQISVDPISLREESEDSFSMLPPVTTGPNLPPPLLPAKLPLVSFSLPNSASSSPRFSFALMKKKWKNENHESPHQIHGLVNRHTDHLPMQQESHLRRSKSCAEGRSSAPADELDLWFTKPNAAEYKLNNNHGNFFKTESPKDHWKNNPSKSKDPCREEFKCGALCLYLPGFVKGKPVKAKWDVAKPNVGANNVVSRTVSLEKFECGSWAPSAIINDHEDGDSMNSLYFDLPLELIRTSANDATSPITAAFVFDQERKGVLKKCSSTTRARKSHEYSSRHVRFSTSSSAMSYPASPAASCITPRLRKAREDFNAFLEAQHA